MSKTTTMNMIGTIKHIMVMITPITIIVIINISVAHTLQSRKIAIKATPRMIDALCASESTSNSELS